MTFASLRHLPVKRKLLVVTMAACGVILLLACVGLFAFQVFIFKRTFARDLETLSAVVAANAAGPVAFGDQKTAEEILSALAAEQKVKSSVIQLADGSVLASQGPERTPGPITPETAPDFHGSELVVSHPIVNKGQSLGSLTIWADFGKTYTDLVWLYAGILLLIFGSAFVVALLVASRLQRFITEPVLNLADTARRIAQQRDYSVRARKMGEDELGFLTDAFNQMLGQIETQDAAVRDSEGRYRLLFEASPVPMYVFELERQQFLAVNGAAVRHYGYSEEEFLAMTIRELRPIEPEAGAGWEQRPNDTRVPWNVCHRKKDGTIIYVELTSHQIEFQGRRSRLVLALDVTDRKRAEEDLAQLHKQLVEASRSAGMAEVANSVLHNVGNVLNSVNVSANMLADRLRDSALKDFPVAADLLRTRAHDLAAFLTTDPQGQQLPGFLLLLARHWTQEQATLLKEAETLTGHVQHIKEVVKRQQALSGLSGLVEAALVTDVIEDALAITDATLARHQVRLERELTDLPPLLLDKVKIEQIIVNLVRNAQEALAETGQTERFIRVRTEGQPGGQIRIQISDNGPGIASDVLNRLFTHGFTTKKTGHGFGLHASCIAAREMGGALNVYSKGPGHGASFTLVLPARIPGQNQPATRQAA